MQNMRQTAERLFYLDWLRVLAMIGIFFFHNARFYDVFNDWHVRNATTNLAASGLVAFMSLWIMPLFFVIAAAGTYYALKSRRAGQFIQERTLRLFVPLVFGMLVIVMPQAYFEAVSHGELASGYNFFEICILYFQTLPDLNWFHLWFLAYLFVFSLVTLPLVITRKGSGTSILSRAAAAVEKPWILLPLLVILLAAINIFIFPDGFWGHRGSGGWNIVAYVLFFISGYVIFANARIMESVKKLRWITLCIAIIAAACLLAFFLDAAAEPADYYGTTEFALAHLIEAISTWGWLLTILGMGKQYLDRNSRFVTYSNEAVLPFYILHQTVIISIGFYVVQWNTGVGIKYLTIATTSFIAIMAIYELLIRRVNILRFLFGMKSKRKPAAVPAK